MFSRAFKTLWRLADMVVGFKVSRYKGLIRLHRGGYLSAEIMADAARKSRPGRTPVGSVSRLA
jgi:hypothetical protein